MELGSVVIINGQTGVQFSLDLGYSSERVWSAVTEPDQLQQWFPSALNFEPVVGGQVDFSGDPNIEDLKGVVLEYQRARRFGFTWADSEVHFTLEQRGAQSCQFILLNVLAAANEAARNAAGWQICLHQLETLLSHGSADGPHGDAGTDWPAVYDAYVLAGFPHGARIPE